MRPKQKVTSSDVARRAGVSQATVSKVVNNSAVLTAATRAKVIQAAHDLGYTLSPRSNGKYHFALLFPGGSLQGYSCDLLSGLIVELLKQKIPMELTPCHNLEILNERCVNGVIAINWEKDFLERYRKTLSLPVVRIAGNPSHKDDIYTVFSDGMTSMKFLIDKLWSLNHRKIGFFFFDTLTHEINNVSKRRDGFLHAMRSHDVENPEEFCTYNCMERDNNELAILLKKWYDSGVTALIFANAYGTGKMMTIINKTKISVPSELSLIGWEFDSVSEYMIPPLNTFDIEPFKVAATAIKLLKQVIDKKGNIKDIYLPYRYIERESVAQARILPPDQGA